MQTYNDLVRFSMIGSVERVGADVVVSLRHKYRSRNRCYNGTVTFGSVTRIDSVDHTSDLVERELERNFRVNGLTFQDGVAKLHVSELDISYSYSITHSINCASVRVRMRMDIRKTLFNLLLK